MPVFRLSDNILFPPTELAEPDGLLAVGGDLGPERLLAAYGQGIFPWYGAGDPILWWSPSPRLIIEPNAFRTSRRLGRLIRQQLFTITMDQAFARVINGCATIPRRGERSTWIVPEMVQAYIRLHELGFAHSVECWRQGELAGGLYGVALGKIFFGESMFSRSSNSSKIALAALVAQLKKWDFALIDCQVASDHLLQFGAREVSRREFETRLKDALTDPGPLPGQWRFEENS
ncbi:MAG: leucyl/phenylalanyl-tRNA--protein transferase [Desulfobacterales bacterium]|nr:leucyl/phenylalanyl-tRNA--protein transferase [Desulfobacterales bacterium]